MRSALRRVGQQPFRLCSHRAAPGLRGEALTRRAMKVATGLQQPTVDDAGTRQPVELCGWQIQGVSVAGQARSFLCWVRACNVQPDRRAL